MGSVKFGWYVNYEDSDDERVQGNIEGYMDKVAQGLRQAVENLGVVVDVSGVVTLPDGTRREVVGWPNPAPAVPAAISVYVTSGGGTYSARTKDAAGKTHRASCTAGRELAAKRAAAKAFNEQENMINLTPAKGGFTAELVGQREAT